MFSSTALKTFLVLAALFCASCQAWQSAENVNREAIVAEEIKTGIPFSTAEPEIFQAEIIVSTGSAEKKFFTARNKAGHLTVFNRGEKDEIAVLRAKDGETYVINREKKTFRKNQNGAGDSLSVDRNLLDFLTTKWLVEKRDATFENLGAENNLTKYRVRFADSNSSEILVFVDENLKIPVKQEFYSLADGQKNLMYSTEVRNFKLQAEDGLFELPKDYREISPKDKNE
ncbi:MAG TPA: hypothetical protein VK892_18335 [Pyrinomonadaceae bacterium]|nr:hypothetical protein [Pyrinomonadaceae bacterium]